MIKDDIFCEDNFEIKNGYKSSVIITQILYCFILLQDQL